MFNSIIKEVKPETTETLKFFKACDKVFYLFEKKDEL